MMFSVMGLLVGIWGTYVNRDSDSAWYHFFLTTIAINAFVLGLACK